MLLDERVTGRHRQITVGMGLDANVTSDASHGGRSAR
jgi:hypothetical protein